LPDGTMASERTPAGLKNGEPAIGVSAPLALMV